MTNEVQTDLEIVNKALVSLSNNVTASDRKEAPYSQPTIFTYLRGEGKKLDVAMSLLAFFRSRIENRRAAIMQTEHHTAA